MKYNVLDKVFDSLIFIAKRQVEFNLWLNQKAQYKFNIVRHSSSYCLKPA